MKRIVAILLLIVSFFTILSCDNEDLEKTKEEIELIAEELLNNIPNEVTSDLLFIRKKDDVEIKWATSDTKIISNQGKVYRQYEDVIININIELSYKDILVSKEKEVKVIKLDTNIINISDILNGEVDKDYEAKGVVKAFNERSFLISDDTGTILVYKGNNWINDLKVNDIVYVKGKTTTYEKAIQFSSDTEYIIIENNEKVDDVPYEITNNDFEEIIKSNNFEIKYVEFKAVILVNDKYINFIVSNSSISGTIAYPNNYDDFLQFNNEEVKITGYIINVTSGKYLSVLCTSVVTEQSNDDKITINTILNSNLGSYDVTGTVVGINLQSFIIDDGTGKILVYKSKDWNIDIKLGDIVLVKGTTVKYANSIQFSSNTTYEIIGHNDTYVYEYEELTDSLLNYNNLLNIMPISLIKYTGTINANGNYYNMTTGSNITITLSYPLESIELDTYLDKNVTIYGFFTSINYNYAQILITSITENSFENTFDLHILEMNDVHGYCLQNEYGKNGISNIAYLIDEIRNQNPLDDCILIGNGDMFQGTAISNITYGKTILELMNIMNFDCMTIGNHEFDWKLDTLLEYFDGDKTNGEANFPLLNANVYTNDHKLVTIKNGNIFESIIIKKENVKVGIIGYIGDVYTSISYPCRKDYYFDNDIENSVLNIGSYLKQKGCDVIIVSIHGGDSSSIANYYNNNLLANLKYDGNYLVDAVINGHTHSKQTGYINRDGVKLPVVQGGSNSQALGEIILKIDNNTNKVVACSSRVYDSYEADNNYNIEVENKLQTLKTSLNDTLDYSYSIAGETIYSKAELFPWAGNVLAASTGSDIGICNNGGIRSTGNIEKGFSVTIENMYMINPFDNYLILTDLRGYEILNFIDNNAVFYGFDGLSITDLNDYQVYKVCVVDYVYYWDSFPKGENTYFTNLIMRDVLIEDCKKRKVFKPITESIPFVDNLLTDFNQY